MAVPKSRTSKSNVRKRRASNMRYTPKTHNACQNCGELKAPHHLCPKCGFYGSKSILPVVEVE